MRTRLATVLGALVVACAIWTSGNASAQDDVTGNLRFTKIYSYGGGARARHQGGLDLRYSIFPTRTPLHVGAFAQSAYEFDAGDVYRFAGGITLGFAALQLEVGISHRTTSAFSAGSTGLHIGKQILLGPFAIGGRITIPLVDHMPENVADPPVVQGFEAALVISFGWDINLHGPSRDHSIGQGGGCHH